MVAQWLKSLFLRIGIEQSTTPSRFNGCQYTEYIENKVEARINVPALPGGESNEYRRQRRLPKEGMSSKFFHVWASSGGRKPSEV
jgi:hypothetical protein